MRLEAMNETFNERYIGFDRTLKCSITHADSLKSIHKNRGFHKLPTTQECQYCQLCFSCAISNELDQ